MLFNWIECNNYSITIGPELRKVLANYYSRSNDPDSRAVQNIFRGLTKSGLLVKCKKSDLICKANKTYEVTYRIPFIVSQQTLNKNFIKLHEEIIQLKSELHQRSRKYLISKEYDVEAKDIDKAVDNVLSNVIGKVSKRNIEALGRVNFSARIDFSVEGGLRIAEIENVNNIEPSKTSDFYTQDELEPLLYKMRTAKQKQLLSSHFLDLKETYMVKGKTAFNKKFNSINGLGRPTKVLLLSSFKGD